MDELSYEEAYEKLDAAVNALQDGHMSLEQALQHYEEGMRLAQYCNEILQKAELRVQQLSTDEQGMLNLQPLDLP